jgi:protein TonB
MLAYAASRRRELADRRPYPNMMLLIIGAHVAALALVMSAKMDLPKHFTAEPPLIVDTIKPPPPTPPIDFARTQTVEPLIKRSIDQQPEVKLPPVVNVQPPAGGEQLGSGYDGSTGTTVIPHVENVVHAPSHVGPSLLTSPSEMKPPYPAMKLLNEEEGEVTVRLTINEQGRVIAVEPVGKADPAFLDAARRHLLAHWRFRPASEDGHAVSSSMIITLRFQLDD